MSQELIKLNDKYGELTEAIQSQGVMVALNQNPDPKWVKKHPVIANYNYLPIERIEFLLKSIFKTNYRIEVLKTGLLLNCVEVTVRVHFKDVVTNEWSFHDGVGAAEIQTAKGTGHLQLDMSNINRGAITMALPIAKTIAIKDACDHFGKLFGSDLNRKDYIEYEYDLTIIPMDEKHPNWDKVVIAAKSGKYSLDQMKGKYNFTKEAEEYINGIIQN